jgi:hypothetical protein
LSFFDNIEQACLRGYLPAVIVAGLPAAHFGGRQQSDRRECLSCQQMNSLDSLYK